jgi:hypothetical protein
LGYSILSTIMMIRQSARSVSPVVSQLNRQGSLGLVVAHTTLEARRKSERGGEIFNAARAWVERIRVKDSVSRSCGETG